MIKYFTIFVVIIFKLHSSETSLHEFDSSIIIEEECDGKYCDDESIELIMDDERDELLYDLTYTFPIESQSISQEYANKNLQSRKEPLENFVQRMAKAFDSMKYKKCLECVADYEHEIHRPPRVSTRRENILALSYKAYSKYYLKSYKSALRSFDEIINLMKVEGGYHKECLFFLYLQHACCYAALGKSEKAKKLIKKLVDLQIGPTIDDLKARNYAINRQPCFHEHPLIQEERLVINDIVATALGQSIVDLKNKGQLIPTCMNCSITNEKIELCETICHRFIGYASVASAFIPNKALQAFVLYVLVEFGLECPKCCNQGLGSEHCCKNLKWVLTTIAQGIQV